MKEWSIQNEYFNLKLTEKGSIYIDVLGSSTYKECYSDALPVSRRQDELIRRKFMKFVKTQMGSLASEALPHYAEAYFADGTKVIANMTDKDYQYKNNKIKAHSFSINKEIK